MTASLLPQRRIPELKSRGTPHWYHHHGQKMQYEKTGDGPIVYIRGSAAFLEIHPFAEKGWTTTYQWNVRWRVKLSYLEEASGNCLFSTEQLECAFGLREAFSEEIDIRHSNWMIQEHGGSVAFQGRFIRWDKYLTIPAPGMGHDGVAAVSIELNDEIKNAVREAIRRRFPERAPTT